MGFHGLKDGIRLASAADEDFRPDWTQFDGGVKSLTQTMDILTKVSLHLCIKPFPILEYFEFANTT